MKFIIDLTACKMPPWWGESWPLQLSVEDGKHNLEFDIIKDTIAPDIYEDMERSIVRRDADIANYLPEAYTIPIGFNRRSLPKGAVIVHCP